MATASTEFLPGAAVLWVMFLTLHSRCHWPCNSVHLQGDPVPNWNQSHCICSMSCYLRNTHYFILYECTLLPFPSHIYHLHISIWYLLLSDVSLLSQDCDVLSLFSFFVLFCFVFWALQFMDLILMSCYQSFSFASFCILMSIIWTFYGKYLHPFSYTGKVIYYLLNILYYGTSTVLSCQAIMQNRPKKSNILYSKQELKPILA